MRKRILAGCFAILFCLLLIPMRSALAEADAGKYITIILDDSGSMSSANRWEYACYAMKMFSAMIGKNDTLVIQPLNRRSAVSISGNRIAENIDNVDSKIPVLPDGNTQFRVVRSAYETLRAAPQSEKWMVVISDGQFSDTSEPLKEMLDYSASCNCKTIFLGLSLQDTAPYGAEGDPALHAQNYFPCFAKDTGEIIDSVANVANIIFGNYELNHDSIRTTGGKLEFDLTMPVEEMIVLAQGQGLFMGELSAAGKTVAGNKGTLTSGSLSGCVGRYAGDLPRGKYVIDVGQTPQSYHIYVRPVAELGIQLMREDGTLLSPDTREILPGTYTYRVGLLDPHDGSIIENNPQTKDIYDTICTTVEIDGTLTEGQAEGRLTASMGDVLVYAEATLPPSGKKITTGAEEKIILRVMSDMAPQPKIRLFDKDSAEVSTGFDALAPGEYTYRVDLESTLDPETREKVMAETVLDVVVTDSEQTASGEQTGVILLTVGDSSIAATATAFGASSSDRLDMHVVGTPVLTFDQHATEWDVHQIDSYTLTLRASFDGTPMTDAQVQAMEVEVDCTNDTLQATVERNASNDAWTVHIRAVPDDPYDIKTGRTGFTAAATLKMGGAEIPAVKAETAVTVSGVPFLVLLSRWLKQNWWWVAALLALIVLLIIWLRSKALPRKVVSGPDAAFTIARATINSNPGIKYSVKAMKSSGTLSIEAPQVALLYPTVNCSVTFGVSAVDPRFKKSAKRRMEITTVKGGPGISRITVGTATYDWNAKTGMYVKNAGGQTTRISSGNEVVIDGTAMTHNGRNCPARLKQTIKFK